MDGERSLNTEQLQAIKHGVGPLLIIAGAGTGKTTVITERVKHLVLSRLAKPSEILALTFTEKAALEMETRIDEALPLGYTQMSVQTFHGFCDSALRESAMHIGVDPSYKLMTTAESIDLLKQNLFAFGLQYFLQLGNPTKFLFGLLNHFSRLQDEDISPTEYLDWVKKFEEENKHTDSDEVKLETQKWKELSIAYKKYDELKIKKSLFDFGDLISKTLLLFRSRPNVLEEYKKRFKFILVDEFQDTNYSQNELAKLLAGNNGNITVVGDDDQSIYKFRGAAVSNMISFSENFPTVKIVTLNKNYRSKKQILDSAYTLINHNNPDRLEVIEKINKKLTATRSGDGTVSFNLFENSSDEASFVSKKIIEIQSDKEVQFNDFAILVRANSHADAFIRSFEQNGIPYQFLGPGKLYMEEEIIDLISYLKILSNIYDNASMYRVLSMEVFKIDPIVVAKLSSQVYREKLNLFDLCLNLTEDINAEEKVKIEKVVSIITKHLSRVKEASAGELLYEFVNESGVVVSLTEQNTPESLVKIENIAKLFVKIKNLENTNPESNVASVVDFISMQQELGESPAASEIDWKNNNAVNILTVHSAKGLEFSVVFMGNLVGLRFPTTNRREQIPIPDSLVRDTLPTGDFHLQEERRLFYVGMTRAKDELCLTAAKFYGEEKREKKISPFVVETVGESVVNKQVIREVVKEEKPTEIIISKSNKIVIKSLSYSQIETFIVCPLHYKLRYLLNVPTEPTSSQSFGISFHATLKSFEEEVKKGAKSDMTLMELLLQKNWIKVGYLNHEHREESYKKALNFLDYYIKNYFDPSIVNLSLEQSFSTRLDGLSLKGKIDRVDESGNGIHIIDYKTGATPLTQKEADKNLQLSIYALAASRIKEDPFNRDAKDIKLSLYYFDSPQIVTTHRTQEQLDEAVDEIYQWKKQIEDSDFRCSGNFLCNSCEYKLYCTQENGN